MRKSSNRGPHLAGKGTGDDFDDGARESKGGQTGSCAVGLHSVGAERKRCNRDGSSSV